MANRIKGITVEIGGDTTKLQTALKGVNGEIRNTQSQLKDVEKLLKLDPGNIELLAQKHKLLGQAVEETKGKLETLKTAAEQANMALANGEISQEQYDALQREIIETENDLKKLEEQANQSATAMQKIAATGEKLKTTGNHISNAGKKLLPVTAAVTGLGTAAVATAANFESSMSQVQATMGITKDSMSQVNGESVNTMDTLSELAKKMGAETAFSASECAEALKYLALAGYDTQQMCDTLPTVLELASAGGIELASASDMVTDAMSTLGMGVSEAGTMVDQMAKTASTTNTSVAQLGEGILTIGATAKSIKGDTAELNTVMHNESGYFGDAPCFPDDKRPEQIVKEAIEYFNKEYGCRIFNLSAGDSEHLYSGGRQFAWAEMLDQLSKQLDILIVISAGNVSNPQINDFSSREELMEKCRDQLFYPEHRLIDPATSALSVTVGSITRFDEPEVTPNRAGRLSVGKKNYLSVFTRIGKGVNRSIKPEFVDYGGNYGVHQISRGNTKWITADRKLVEPTLHNGNDQIFKGYCGTSFSAPHVTHIAARIECALEEQIKTLPSANLIKAVLANSAKCTAEMKKWTEESKDILYTGKSNPKQERRLRLMGFGKVDDSLLYSSDNTVTLFAEDRLELRSFHLYKIPVPKEFLKVKADKTIAISLAYNPITRMSRKDYLTNNLWFEVFRKIDENTLLQYKAKKESGQDEEEDLSGLPDSNKADFSPGYTEILKGTLQQRIWQKGSQGGKDLLWDEKEPYIYVLVTGKERFKYVEQELPQDYALAITFSFAGQDDIKLYTNLRDRARRRERSTQRERTRTTSAKI